ELGVHENLLFESDDLAGQVSLPDNTDAESTKSDGTVASTDSDVKKVGEGRYNIAGRNVFIRLLKGRHMMVRVGGGWDTLEHFLSRHEPCQVRLVTAGRRAAAITLTSERADSLSPASSKASLTRAHGSVSPVDSKASTSRKPSPPRSGKSSPQTSGKSSPANSGKISPASRTNSGLRTSTPKPNKNRASLTLPLRADSVDRPNSSAPRTRKQSAPSFSTPSTPGRSVRTPPVELSKSLTSASLNSNPKKSRSMSLALQKDAKFCGTDRLNQAAAKGRSVSAASTPTETTGRKTRSQSLASTPLHEPKKLLNGTNGYSKKTRSMSLATPVDFRPMNKSSSVTISGALTQAAIEETIRMSLAASIADEHSSKKPFLHIKAKYRSPPPREVPPR
ncbi:putative growth arrest-specific 2, partial [Operophtera brumata]